MIIDNLPRALVVSVAICSTVYFLTHIYSINAAQQFGNQTFYNDSHGRPMGSATDFGGE